MSTIVEDEIAQLKVELEEEKRKPFINEAPLNGPRIIAVVQNQLDARPDFLMDFF